MFEFMETPEWELSKKLDSFMFSLELLQRNYDELCSAIAIFEHAQNPAFLALGEKWKRKAMLKEVMFLLHNYLASAKSLLDHSRVLYRDLYHGTKIFPEYKDEINARFTCDALVQFVHGLREMVQHYKLPSIVSRTTFGEGSFSIKLGIRRADLVAYSSWKAPARAFLAEQTADQIGLLDVCTPYYNKITDFYQWFFARLQVIHADEFARIDQLRDEEVKRDLPETIRRLENEVLRLAKSHQISSVRDILCPFLTLEQQQKLHEHERNEPVWLEAAVPLISERIPLPVSVVTNLKIIAERAHRVASAG